MKKNYYEILEVDKNASKDIIEKAYKILVKKYHPDLHGKNSKIDFETKIKEINEAYETLSDSIKRKEYNLNLENNNISIEEYKKLYNNYNKLFNENILLKKQLNNFNNINLNKNNYYTNYNSSNKNIKNTQSNLGNNINKNNHNNTSNQNNNNNKFTNYKNYIYYKYFKNGYFTRNIIALFLTFIIILSICFILWNIPFTNKYLINLYNKNTIINFFVNLLIK